MKKYIGFILILISISCEEEFLDVVPDNLATVDIAFNNRASAEQWLATCYGYVPDHANPEQNFAMVAGDEIWYYAENDFYMNNETSLRLAKGMQNFANPYLNFWEGQRGGYNLFTAIRDSNTFLENVQEREISGLNLNERRRWIAEVKVLKAYFHFLLLRMYGPIPIIDQNIHVSEDTETTRIKREPVDEAVDYIVNLLDEAIESDDLPQRITSIFIENGRLTLPAAKAIKAKVLMLSASPLFNGNEDYSGFVDNEGEEFINTTFDPQKWIIAKDACLDAIQEAESAEHSLYSFTDLLPIGEIAPEVREELTFRATITDRFNSELIWGVGNNWSLALQEWCQPRVTGEHESRFRSARKSHAPTLNVVTDFYTDKGLPIEEDKTWDYTDRFDIVTVNEDLAQDHKYYVQQSYETVNLHLYREPRFYAWVGFDGGKWFSLETEDTENLPYINAKNGQLSGKNGQELYSITGYFTKKLVNYQNVITTDNLQLESYTFPIIRLSDLYLMYAEALNETKSSPDQEVYEYIQRVRDKAGLDEGSDLVTTWATYSHRPEKPTTKEGMREIIQQERMIELSFEGERYWDLRRWKLAGEYFNQPIRGWNIDGADPDSFYQVKNIYYRDFLTRNYLWPISQTEMLRNPNLIQNPGWGL